MDKSVHLLRVHPCLSGARIGQSLVYCVVFCKLLFVLLSFFLLANALSVLLRFTDTDYPFGIFKLFIGEIFSIAKNTMSDTWIAKETCKRFLVSSFLISTRCSLPIIEGIFLLSNTCSLSFANFIEKKFCSMNNIFLFYCKMMHFTKRTYTLEFTWTLDYTLVNKHNLPLSVFYTFRTDIDYNQILMYVSSWGRAVFQTHHSQPVVAMCHRWEIRSPLV